MKLIRTVDAAGQVLCHDITQIIPGEFKGPRFRKGHIVQPEDIPASCMRTRQRPCCTKLLPAKTSTAPNRKRARSS